MRVSRGPGSARRSGGQPGDRRSIASLGWTLALVVGLAAVVLGPTAWAIAHDDAAAGPSAVTGRIKLSASRVPSGGVVSGVVVLENPTTRPIVVLHGCRVDGLFAIGFRAANGYMDGPVFSDVGCDENLPSNELIANPGTTNVRFRVRATYVSCSGGPELSARYSPDWSPPCSQDRRGRHDVIPALSAGGYSVQFVPEEPRPRLHVAAARLTVLPSR